MDLRNTRFQLLENQGGHASESTLMMFDGSTGPFKATYSGPNVAYGHAIVEDSNMLYHAMDMDGNLTAGIASVEVADGIMTLNWQWLTGDRSSGTSRWREIEA